MYIVYATFQTVRRVNIGKSHISHLVITYIYSQMPIIYDRYLEFRNLHNIMSV